MRGEKTTPGVGYSPHPPAGGAPGLGRTGASRRSSDGRGRVATRRGPRPLALAVGAAVAIIGGAVVFVFVGSGTDGEGASAEERTATTTISRRDLVEVQTEDGTLGYADSRTIVNRMAGTVTWLPRAGAVVRTNARLYAVDGKAVYLLDGSSPAYRDLTAGIAGKDVRALERNLRALGKDPARAMRVDGRWDTGTTAAVKRWQHDKGLEETGAIELGRVVFAPGDRRVSSLELKVGASAGSGSSGGDEGSARPAAYDGADASSGAMQLVAYRAAAGEGSAEAPSREGAAEAASRAAAQAPASDGSGEPPAATPTTPATTTPPATTTTPPATTTPQTTTTPTTTTPAPSAKPEAPKPEAAKPASPAASGRSPGAARDASSGSPSAAKGDSGDDAGSDSGSAPSTNLMTTTSTRRIVTVALDTTKESVAVKGARVTVELPSGDAVHGRIARVGTTATSEQSQDGSSGPPTIKLTIKLTERAKAIDQAPVTVQLERSRRRDVLAIPVTALMARSGGRFAVEVVEGSGRRVVPVTTGLFTSGFVEIEGAGLRPGTRVANAAV